VIAALRKYKNEKNNAIFALLEGSIKVRTSCSNNLRTLLDLELKEEDGCDNTELIENWGRDTRGALNSQYNPSIDSMLNRASQGSNAK
jgi:hypothetical protein